MIFIHLLQREITITMKERKMSKRKGGNRSNCESQIFILKSEKICQLAVGKHI